MVGPKDRGERGKRGLRGAHAAAGLSSCARGGRGGGVRAFLPLSSQSPRLRPRLRRQSIVLPRNEKRRRFGQPARAEEKKTLCARRGNLFIAACRR